MKLPFKIFVYLKFNKREIISGLYTRLKKQLNLNTSNYKRAGRKKTKNKRGA